MSEKGFMLFQYLVAGIETILYASCMTFFFYPFMAGRREQRKNVWKKVSVVFMVYAMVFLICERFSVSGWLYIVIVTALLVPLYKILGMERKPVFLLSVIFFGIRDMSRLITESLYYIFNVKFVHGLYDENMIYRNVAAGYLGAMVFRFILLLAMLLLVSRMMQKEPLQLYGKELIYLCLMPIAGIMFGNIIFRMFFMVKENVFLNFMSSIRCLSG